MNTIVSESFVITYSYLFPSPLTRFVEAAEAARTASKAMQEKIDRTQNKLNDVNKWLEADHGPGQRFAAFESTCFHYMEKQYTYEMCPYGSASQKEGGGSTNLGSWSGISLPSENDGVYKFNFANGAGCWNGPSRSLSVTLRCGIENEIKKVEEPSRCVYAMEMTTPTVCDAARATILQAKLDALLAGDSED